MSEVWLPIAGYEQCGEVSNLGRIRSKNGYIRKTFVSYNGYERVGLLGGRVTVAVHTLVANAFCKGKTDSTQVNHIDGNKLNNTSANLEWVEPSDNIRHAISLGLRKPNNSVSVLADSQVEELLVRVASGETQAKLAREHGVTPKCLWARLNRYKEARLCQQ